MPHYKQPKIGGKCDKSMLRHERQLRVKDKLKEQNIMLKSKLKSLENRLEQSQEKMLGNMATISNLAGKSKLEELKNFIKQLNLNEKTLNRQYYAMHNTMHNTYAQYYFFT